MTEKDEERRELEAAAAGESSSQESESVTPANESAPSATQQGAPKAGAASAPSSGSGAQWFGYLSGLAIIGASAWVVLLGDSGVLRAEPATRGEAAAPVPAVSGPCEQWKTQLCERVGGDTAFACNQAEAAAGLLSDAACRRELSDLPATVTRVNSTRGDCQTLMDRACTDIGNDTDTCKLVRDKTPSFPAERCSEMLKNYDQVLTELQGLHAKGGPGARPPGPRGMAPPPGAGMPPPHAMPPGGPASDPHAGHDHP